VTEFTDKLRRICQDRSMQALVSITIADDDGEEIDTVSASADTPQEAFELAVQQLDLDEEE
jgi:hypothetical protein